MNVDVVAISARLRSAAASGVPVDPIREIDAGDVDTAYMIQTTSVQAWLAAGRRLVGHKIGLTNPKVQSQLGVDQPDFGVLFEDMSFLSGATVPYERVLQPRIEAEMMFLVGNDLIDPNVELAEVAAAVASVSPALEIVGSRITNWQISIADTIADNASSGAFVIGPSRVSLGAVDLIGATMQMTRTRQGVTEAVSHGASADCLGSPLVAAHWLARELARRGNPLSAGDIILTGALGPMVAVEPGDTFQAAISGVGEVGVSFAASRQTFVP